VTVTLRVTSTETASDSLVTTIDLDQSMTASHTDRFLMNYDCSGRNEMIRNVQ
jgi:hypothetical protein